MRLIRRIKPLRGTTTKGKTMSTIHVMTPEGLDFNVFVPTAQLGQRMVEIAKETEGFVSVTD